MKKISLSQGLFAIVDDDDYERLSKHKWHARIYKFTSYAFLSKRVDGKQIGMHRFILNCPSDLQVDHRNGNGLDNRKENLRHCTSKQNNWNRRPINKFSAKGIYKNKKRWAAAIKHDGKQYFLCNTLFKEVAVRVYNYWAKRFGGNFAYLNLV